MWQMSGLSAKSAKSRYRCELVILWLCLLFLLPVGAHAGGPNFYEAPALNGDGVFSLLRRYDLDRYSCNHEQFYKLNNLKRNAPLIVGRYYKLPIAIYTFNGRTIRSTIGIDDYDLALRIQHYNEAMHRAGMRERDFREDKELWVPWHLLHCPEPDIPSPATPASTQGEVARTGPIVKPDDQTASASAVRGRIFPIFGPGYQYVPLQDNRLRGKVFYVVSGHGGPDPGALGKRAGHTLCEDEYAYDVALRLVRMLVAHGATAYMITRDKNDGIRDVQMLECDTDEVIWGDLPIHRGQKARLFQRSDVINQLYERHRRQGVTDQLTIVIHVDSRSRKERTDLFFYHHPESEESKRVAQVLHRTMARKYRRYRANGQYHGTVTARDLHMLREVRTPAVYIELANIRNAWDQRRIVLTENREALAKWLYEGLLSIYAQ